MIIAQITDFHIKPPGEIAYRQVDTARCLAAAVSSLGTLVPAPDAVLATGDLVDGGLAEEYALLRRLLAPLAMPVYLLPGNHDDRAALRAAFPEHTHLGSDGPIRYVIEDHALRLVVLDSLVPGEGGGRLGAEQLAWLDAVLQAAPARPTVLALHHPPFPTLIGYMDKIGLADAGAFCRSGAASSPGAGRAVGTSAPADRDALGRHYRLDGALDRASDPARSACRRAAGLSPRAARLSAACLARRDRAREPHGVLGDWPGAFSFHPEETPPG